LAAKGGGKGLEGAGPARAQAALPVCCLAPAAAATHAPRFAQQRPPFNAPGAFVRLTPAGPALPSSPGDVGTDVPRILINRERVGHSPAAKALERSARAAAHASGGGRHHHPAGGASSSSSSSDDEGACKDEHGQGPGRGQQAHVPDEAAAAAAAAAAALEWEAEQEREREREEEGYGSDSGDSVGSDGSGSSSGSGLSGGFDFGLPSNGRDAVHLGDADDAAWRLASLLGWSGELEALIQADAAARAAEAGGREE
jgi:hypothetical protein